MYWLQWSWDLKVHGCTLEDSIVSFTCTRDNRVFALRDTGDVMVTGLSPPKAAPPEPLPMHPMSEDNYGTDEGTALLVLETIPPTLIIAHSRGNSTLYHCVYMEGDKERGSEEEGEGLTQASSDSLYVVECVKLDLQVEDEPLSLTKDPVLPYRYFISHSEGVHMVTIPWANRMDQFTTSTMEELVMRADSDVRPLIDVEDPTISSVQGMAVISEPLLGPSAVFLTSDLECHVCLLRLPPPAQFVTATEATPTRPHPQVRSDTSGFEKVIRDILEEYQDTPLLHTQKRDLSQQECFDFLQRSVQSLRAKYLLPQKKAKAALQRRLDVLCRQKEQQLRDLVALRDEHLEVMERSEDMRGKMALIQQQSSQLLLRLERLLCKLEAQSPILSDAEISMEQELSQLPTKLQAMHYQIEEAKGKLRLGYGEASGRERVNMSKAQDARICSVLEDAGRRLLSLKMQIKSLVGAMPS
jgi:nuclear pore complex protein Nup88